MTFRLVCVIFYILLAGGWYFLVLFGGWVWDLVRVCFLEGMYYFGRLYFGHDLYRHDIGAI